MVRPNQHSHAVKLHTPYYADSGDGCMIHRFMDENFVDRFHLDAAKGALTGIAAQPWRNTDRFGKKAQDHVNLRLPIHRTFYMASCEISCDVPGSPALDPARIVNAGMVIRRGTVNNYKSWQVREGAAIGWSSGDLAELEPDQYKRLLNRKLIRRQPRPPLYSGEQTHPLHARVYSVEDENGRVRNHTLLSGFIPLSGSVEASLIPPAFAAEEKSLRANNTVRADGQLSEQQWPFGSWDGVSAGPSCSCSGTLHEVAGNLCEKFSWNQSTGWQIRNGTSDAAFNILLRTLMERYQIFDTSIAANEALRSQLSQIYFYRSVYARSDRSGDAVLGSVTSGDTLLNYLINNQEAILGWLDQLSQYERGAIASLPPLLNSSRQLYVKQAQAASLRELLVLRAEAASEQQEAELPLPRYGQAADDIYFLRPFVRYRDDCGCEHIAWGPASKPFRVVSPMDPEAVRPTVIQLPELADIKRGVAKGVTFLTPKSLADMMEKISPDLDFKESGKGNRFSACLGLSISFSIPIITICAMILLMIILNLLNIFLRWLPFAFLKLPRGC